MAERHKDFSCPACGAEFDTSEQLQKHSVEHERNAQPGVADATGGSQGSRTPEKK